MAKKQIPQGFMDSIQLAQRWNKSPFTIRSARIRKVGPPYIKTPSNKVFYKLQDIIAYEKEKGFHEMVLAWLKDNGIRT